MHKLAPEIDRQMDIYIYIIQIDRQIDRQMDKTQKNKKKLKVVEKVKIRTKYFFNLIFKITLFEKKNSGDIVIVK